MKHASPDPSKYTVLGALVLLAALMPRPALGSVAMPAGQSPDIVGEAIDPRSGKVLYVEHYYCTDNDLECSVYYLRPDAVLIASKQLNYEGSLKGPALTFRDFRTDQTVSIAPSDGDVVVDAGFDNFVRLQWQDLTDGADVVFPFRMVTREEPLTMRARRQKNCADGQLCLEVRLDSWLLGVLVDPIHLVYDRESRRLQRFAGISNLKDENGKSRKVEIRYRYAEEGGRAAAVTGQ